jgi:xanthine dehydrogenase accessory factor
MKELADILRAFAAISPEGDSALATVVRVTGSAYRSPGARMLIAGDGRLIGQISGGCLERDVQRRAGGVMLSKQPALVRYDTSNDPESGTGYSLGCGGAIEILIEPLNVPAGIELMHWLAGSRSGRRVVATVICKNHPLAPLGQRMMVDTTEAVSGSVGTPRLSRAVAGRAITAIKGDHSISGSVATPEGDVDLFFDVVKPPTELLIFGAGNDVVPLVGFGRALGWTVTVVDLGSAASDPARSLNADRIIRCSPDELTQQVSIGCETAAVIMTHHFSHDQKLIRWLSTQPLKYLGLLGPRHRTDELLGDLQPDQLRAPVGLDIGAESPAEVALSIVAEINAVLRGRSGAPISQREGPIHVRPI